MLMYCLTHRSYKLFCVRFIQKRFHLSNEKYSLDEAFQQLPRSNILICDVLLVYLKILELATRK